MINGCTVATARQKLLNIICNRFKASFPDDTGGLVVGGFISSVDDCTDDDNDGGGGGVRGSVGVDSFNRADVPSSTARFNSGSIPGIMSSKSMASHDEILSATAC